MFKLGDKFVLKSCLNELVLKCYMPFGCGPGRRHVYYRKLFASLTLLRGAQTLPFLGTISTVQPPHNKRQGYGTLLVLFIVLGWEGVFLEGYLRWDSMWVKFTKACHHLGG